MEVKRIKETEGGANAMCAIMKQYEDRARNEGRNEGLAEGLSKGTYLTLWNLVKDGILSTEEAAKRCQMTVEEFLKVKPAEE